MQLVLLLAEVCHQRLPVLNREVSLVLSEREDEHVQVSRRPSQSADPRELGREVLDYIWSEYVSDLAEQ